MKNNLIIWDWNGTLLNDVEACVESMNVMLARRKMKKIDNERYKAVFTFPVQDYYKKVGFDFSKESFDQLSIEYIDLYTKYSTISPLQPGAVEMLQYFKNLNYMQVILSASEQLSLENQVKQREISGYFDSLIGLDNIHARSKVDNAKSFIKSSQKKFDQTILIGDTLHDYEVATEIGAYCILVEQGHQHLENKQINGNAVIVESLQKIRSLYNHL